MKNFRLLIVCSFLIFLDMPSPFNACRDDRTGLEVDVLVVDNENIMFNSSELKLVKAKIDFRALGKTCFNGSSFFTALGNGLTERPLKHTTGVVAK